jgi:hypothetical protein
LVSLLVFAARERMLHALACYLITTKDRASHDSFLFPDLQQLKKGVASKVSTVVVEFDNAIQNSIIPPGVTSKVFLKDPIFC